VFLLDALRRNPTVRDARRGFLHQVHSRLSMRLYRFNTKVAHFVSKDFDAESIRQQIRGHGLELSRSL
jgi:hypothetical protein